ncbi:MAG: hypothetical protein H7138_21645 [Myxococcales bacterium]|nr:hypothetical protein [Myxococcales bacterium]
MFVDRYHLVVIKSPTQARHALAYVLGNWRKHGEDRSGPARNLLLDPYASGRSFPGWKELEHEREHVMRGMLADHEPLVVQKPTSWLLSVGWKLAGDVSAREIPTRRRGA